MGSKYVRFATLHQNRAIYFPSVFVGILVEGIKSLLNTRPKCYKAIKRPFGKPDHLSSYADELFYIAERYFEYDPRRRYIVVIESFRDHKRTQRNAIENYISLSLF